MRARIKVISAVVRIASGGQKKGGLPKPRHDADSRWHRSPAALEEVLDS